MLHRARRVIRTTTAPRAVGARPSPRASITLLLAAALVVGVAACGGPVAPSVAPSPSPAGSPVATPGASSTPVASATPAATAAIVSPSPADDAWHLVELPDGADVGTVGAVIASPGLIVAAGSAGPAGDRSVAWSSEDGGTTWTSELLPGNAARSIGRLVAWGDRILAIGEGDGDCPHPSVVDIWVRDATGTWTAAPADPLFCAGGLPEAAVSGGRAVVLGTGSGDVAYAWSSDDGLKWSDHSDVFVDRLPQGVAVGGDGFTAFGTGFDPAPAWTSNSPDGVTWQKPEPLPGLAGTSMIGNPVVLDGQPAVFVADAGGAFGILRPDGQGGWHTDQVERLTRSTLARFVAVDGGLVALGGGDQGPAAWVSSDGLAWRPLTLPPEATASGTNGTLTGVTVADGRAYLVGQILAPGGDHSVGALWTGPAALLEP